MAPFTSLPPELLLDIVSAAATFDLNLLSIFQNPEALRSRGQELSHLSRVHPSFTYMIRPFMVEHIEIERSFDHAIECRALSTLRWLNSPPWTSFKIKHLVLRGTYVAPDQFSCRWSNRLPALLVSPADVRPFANVVWLLCDGGTVDLYLLSLIKSKSPMAPEYLRTV